MSAAAVTTAIPFVAETWFLTGTCGHCIDYLTRVNSSLGKPERKLITNGRLTAIAVKQAKRGAGGVGR
jgi:hypothetical protein